MVLVPLKHSINSNFEADVLESEATAEKKESRLVISFGTLSRGHRALLFTMPSNGSFFLRKHFLRVLLLIINIILFMCGAKRATLHNPLNLK